MFSVGLPKDPPPFDRAAFEKLSTDDKIFVMIELHYADSTAHARMLLEATGEI